MTINNCQVRYYMLNESHMMLNFCSPFSGRLRRLHRRNSLWNTGNNYLFIPARRSMPRILQTSGSLAIIDATINNTPIFVRTSVASGGTLDGSLVINNAKLTNVPVAVGVESTGQTVLAGGTTTIASWGQGNVFHGTSATGTFTQGSVVAASKPASLLDSSGKIFGRTHPQYAAFSTSQFVSVKSNGAKGDGVTDDTAAITAIFNQVGKAQYNARMRAAHDIDATSDFCSSRDARSSSLTLGPI